MYLSIKEVKEEMERILKNPKVLSSACNLETRTASEKGMLNTLRVEINYIPNFSKQETDEIDRMVLFKNKREAEKTEKLEKNIRYEEK